jgi:hypothetical protein
MIRPAPFSALVVSKRASNASAPISCGTTKWKIQRQEREREREREKEITSESERGV